jgi:hypothetical protein
MPPVYTYGNNSCGCNRRYWEWRSTEN